jgi:hypothetical protein
MNEHVGLSAAKAADRCERELGRAVIAAVGRVYSVPDDASAQTLISSLRDKLAEAEGRAFGAAATQCVKPAADEYGNFYCEAAIDARQAGYADGQRHYDPIVAEQARHIAEVEAENVRLDRRVAELAAEEATPEMLAAGWRILKRDGVKLAPGPALAETYAAMRRAALPALDQSRTRAKCPYPYPERPIGFLAADCIAAGECGCDEQDGAETGSRADIRAAPDENKTIGSPPITEPATGESS